MINRWPWTRPQASTYSERRVLGPYYDFRKSCRHKEYGEEGGGHFTISFGFVQLYAKQLDGTRWDGRKEGCFLGICRASPSCLGLKLSAPYYYFSPWENRSLINRRRHHNTPIFASWTRPQASTYYKRTGLGAYQDFRKVASIRKMGRVEGVILKSLLELSSSI